MDTSRLRPGEVLAAAGGVLLLVLLVMDWFGVRTEARPEAGEPLAVSVGLNAWQAFDVLDVFLALTALAAIAAVVLNVVQRSPALPVAAEVITTALALLALLAVAYRLLDQPGPNAAVGVEPGAYLGLLAVAGIVYGSYRALRDESARGTPVPEVDLRPAPPAVPRKDPVAAPAPDAPSSQERS